jgi:hypothetical protein
MFPLCERMRETVPSFLYSTPVVWGGNIADFWSGITEEGILLAKGLLSLSILWRERKTEESNSSHGTLILGVVDAPVRSRSGNSPHVITECIGLFREMHRLT